MKAIVSILFLCAWVGLASCGQDAGQKMLAARSDSLFISVRSVGVVTTLITDNFLMPGQKKAVYKMEYIRETWPDTITPAQAARLTDLQDLAAGYEKLVSTGKDLRERSTLQLEQLKKLNASANSGLISSEDLRQYLIFESKCADTLNRVLDSLVKRSIELSCKIQSL